MARYSNPEGITVIYSTRQSSPGYQEHIRKTCHLGDRLEIIEVVNDGQWGLSELYNRVMKDCKYDIVVFMHDDLIFETYGWGRILLRNFARREVEIIGLAGVHTDFPDNGCWWHGRYKAGIVNHIKDGQKFATVFSPEQGDRIKKVMSVDGLFIAARKSRLAHSFDESFTGFHFYDLGFCFPNYLEGVDIGVVTNIRVTHMSVGNTNDEWERNRLLFVEKYADDLPCKQE